MIFFFFGPQETNMNGGKALPQEAPIFQKNRPDTLLTPVKTLLPLAGDPDRDSEWRSVAWRSSCSVLP